MSSLHAVYGASGFGREVAPLVRETLTNHKDSSDLVFVDDSPTSELLNGIRVLSWQEFRERKEERKSAYIAIADGKIREKIFLTCTAIGVEHPTLISSNSVIMDEVSLGEGSILSPFTSITSNVRIGKGFHCNIYSYVAHDCIIGDFVTFAPRVMCNGNVTIEDHAYIGTGAIIKQGVPGQPVVIGAGAIVGMGAVVTKSVPPNTTVVGNPARILERK